MEAFAIIPSNRLIEYHKPMRVYVKEQRERKAAKKIKRSYPQILMPEQPTGYLKQKANDLL